MDKSKQAFPIPHTVADANDSAFKLGNPGMTLREYAAVAAMQGLLANSGWTAHLVELSKIHGVESHEERGIHAGVTTRIATDLADALLARLEDGK